MPLYSTFRQIWNNVTVIIRQKKILFLNVRKINFHSDLSIDFTFCNENFSTKIKYYSWSKSFYAPLFKILTNLKQRNSNSKTKIFFSQRTFFWLLEGLIIHHWHNTVMPNLLPTVNYTENKPFTAPVFEISEDLK